MRINYHKDTDSLYIHLSDRATDESEEIAPDTVAHFDQDGELIGIEFYSDFGERFGLETFEVSGLDVKSGPEIVEVINRTEQREEDKRLREQTKADRAGAGE